MSCAKSNIMGVDRMISDATWIDYANLTFLSMIYWKLLSIYDKLCEGDE